MMIKHEDNLLVHLGTGPLRALAGATVTAVDRVTSLPVVLCSDESGTPINGAVVTDIDGYYGFYVHSGTYVVTYQSPRMEAPVTRTVTVGDPLAVTARLAVAIQSKTAPVGQDIGQMWLHTVTGIKYMLIENAGGPRWVQTDAMLVLENTALVDGLRAEITAGYPTKQALAAGNGSTQIGYGNVTLQTTLDRMQARYGKVSSASLPRFMSRLRTYDETADPAIHIVGFGSSVGVGLGLLSVNDAPVNHLSATIRAALPANIFNIVVSNQCVSGSIMSQFPAAWASMIAAGITAPAIVDFAYGMNDFRVENFNGGQTFPGFYRHLTDAVITAKNAGADVIIRTSPHPRVVTRAALLHQMTPGYAQTYPTNVPANVSMTQIVPSAATSVLNYDVLGEGVNISIDHRMFRINQCMRQVAAEQGCILLDVERYWLEALQKHRIASGSMLAAEALMYDGSEYLHPNLGAYQDSYHLAALHLVKAVFAQSMQDGGEGKSRFKEAYGVLEREGLEGMADVVIATPYVTRNPLPKFASGVLQVAARNGADIQLNHYVWKTNATTITLTAAGTTGAGVFTVSVSGLFLSLTAVVNDTDFQVSWKALTTI